MDVINTTEEHALESLAENSISFLNYWFLRFLSFISYFYFSIFKSSEETNVRSINDNEDRRLNFLIIDKTLKDDSKFDDIRRALCLDLNLGEKHEKHIVHLFKSFFETKNLRKLTRVILEKFLQRLNSGTYDHEVKKKYDVTVDFSLRDFKVFDDDARTKITNLAKFLVLRTVPVETEVIISFDDFDLILKKIKISSSTDEYNHENSLQELCEEEKECKSALEDSADSECSTDKDAPYKYIFPNGTMGQLFYNLKSKPSHCQNKEQELLQEKKWEEFIETVENLIGVLRAHLMGVFVILNSIGGNEYKDSYYEFCANNVFREDFIKNYLSKEDSLSDLQESYSSLFLNNILMVV